MAVWCWRQRNLSEAHHTVDAFSSSSLSSSVNPPLSLFILPCCALKIVWCLGRWGSDSLRGFSSEPIFIALINSLIDCQALVDVWNLQGLSSYCTFRRVQGSPKLLRHHVSVLYLHGKTKHQFSESMCTLEPSSLLLWQHHLPFFLRSLLLCRCFSLIVSFFCSLSLSISLYFSVSSLFTPWMLWGEVLDQS